MANLRGSSERVENVTPIQNTLLWTPSAWRDAAVESVESALSRTPPFGVRFFDQLFAEYPGIKDRLTFVRHRSRNHPEVDCFSEWDDDIIAILDQSPKGMGMQIDLHLSYIVIWDENGSDGEHGDWGEGNDQVADAMIQIRKILGTSL